MPGLNYQAIEGMTRRERAWFVKRLDQQQERETEAIEQQQEQHKRMAKRGRRKRR